MFDDQSGLLVHDPVRRAFDFLQLHLWHKIAQPVDQRRGQGDVTHSPDDQRGQLHGEHFFWKADRAGRRVFGRGGAQRRRAVVVAATLQTPAPDVAVLLPDAFCQPRMWAGGGANVGKKLPQPAEIVFGQQHVGIGPAEKIHIRAGRLLGRRMLQFAQKSGRMRRVDDDQLVHQRGLAGRKVPGHGTAPVVRHQACQMAAFQSNQGRDVLHQELGAVGRNVGGRAGTLEAAQVGRDAAVAAVVRVGEIRQQFVPDKSRLGKAMQKHQHRPPFFARRAA